VKAGIREVAAQRRAEHPGAAPGGAGNRRRRRWTTSGAAANSPSLAGSTSPSSTTCRSGSCPKPMPPPNRIRTPTSTGPAAPPRSGWASSRRRTWRSTGTAWTALEREAGAMPP
jgi:hypothetical protein